MIVLLIVSPNLVTEMVSLLISPVKRVYHCPVFAQPALKLRDPYLESITEGLYLPHAEQRTSMWSHVELKRKRVFFFPEIHAGVERL